MANDLNNCSFIGRVGKIETRYTPEGKAICNLSLACNETWKKNGEKHEKCTWVNFVIFNQLAEIADKHVKKGQQLYLSGKLTNRKWQDKQGNDRWSTEIVLDNFNGVMQMLGGKQEGQQKPQQQASQQPQNTVNPNYEFDDFDDSSIPF